MNNPNPVPPKCVLINGTNNINPKKPYTTEGMPAKVSITGFKIFLIVEGANSAIKIAHNTEKGVAMRSVKSVKAREPTISGIIPN